MTPLENRIHRLSCWRGAVKLTPLTGGLSNISFVAEDGAGKFVVRCVEDVAVHHVFRDRERAASIAAFKAGLAPEIVHTEPGLMVLRFVEGRTFVEADLGTNIPRIAALLQACHRTVGGHLAGPPNFFWVFHVIRDYARTLETGGSPFVPELLRFLALAGKLEEAQEPMPIVFGHHDLLAGNLIDDGKRLWLIDWEYGGFGTAMFDLANLASNGGFGPAEDTALLEAYFENEVGDGVRRSFDAMKVASALREAMWAMISDIHLKTPGADYKAHAREYLARTETAVGRFTDRHG